MVTVNTPKQFTRTQIIRKIQNLIDTDGGDVGRLSYILECIAQHKSLYRSDQLYLENKVNVPFMIVDEEKPIEHPILSRIQSLISSGSGDPGRLQYIYDKISHNKPLFNSDQAYLESKLKSSADNIKNDLINFKESSEDNPFIKSDSNNKIVLENTPHTTKLRGVMPKGWNPPENKSNELSGLYEKMKTEEEMLEDNKKMHNELEIQRSKLAQIILNRKEYEKQVLLEKSLLDAQIKEESINIQKQTQISEQIRLQKDEIEKVKMERNELMKEISIEKDQVSKELEEQKNQLSQIYLEQKKIEKQVKQEQLSLAKMIEEQKAKLLKQSQITLDIKDKQIDLEKAKQEYHEILSQVSDEKNKLLESKKMKKLIQSQERDLARAIKARLKIDDIVSKEKEKILIKTKEEQEKLQLQSMLAKQILDEKNTLDEIKQKRKEIEIEIQKLKKQQQELEN
ncbi:hypothetical protein YTPLAS73_09810 [Nitrosarchaeum sp.]|nr:hypothetical protein YTPLAS73_09810 [Nitrosarchaeum sp.]